MFKKITSTLCIFCISAAFTFTARAQTLDEIVTKIIEAKGGMAKIKAIQTITTTGKMIMQGGAMQIPITGVQKRDKGIRFEGTFQGLKFIQGYDGKTGWNINPMAGQTDPVAMPEDQTKEFAEQLTDFDGEFVDYKTKGHVLELLGSEDVEGGKAYKIKVTKKNGTVSTIFIDADSYLQIKESKKTKNPQDGSEAIQDTYMSDYRAVEGVMFNFTQESRVGSQVNQAMKTEKFEVNKPVDEALFVMPAKKAEAKK